MLTRKCKITPLSYRIFLLDSTVLGLPGEQHPRSRVQGQCRGQHPNCTDPKVQAWLWSLPWLPLPFISLILQSSSILRAIKQCSESITKSLLDKAAEHQLVAWAINDIKLSPNKYFGQHLVQNLYTKWARIHALSLSFLPMLAYWPFIHRLAASWVMWLKYPPAWPGHTTGFQARKGLLFFFFSEAP